MFTNHKKSDIVVFMFMVEVKNKRNLMYSLLLGGVILADSIFTVYIGTELNPILLWIMDLFNLHLAEMMFWRTFVIWIAIYFLYNVGFENKYLIFMYITLYGICTVTTI